MIFSILFEILSVLPESISNIFISLFLKTSDRSKLLKSFSSVKNRLRISCTSGDFSLAKETIYNLAKKILENGWISKGKRAPVISLIAKSKESDTVFMIKICM